jgi:oligopeptide transport system ATP-binding protein
MTQANSEVQPLLHVENLKQYFKITRTYTTKAVDGISFDIYPGETYGLVGESGSGKSTTGRAIIRLYTPTDGTIIFDGHDIGKKKLAKEDEAYLRQNMQMIFQDPMACLNPRKKVKEIIAQGLMIHHMYTSKKDLDDQVYAILDKVGLSREQATRYPQQFSGGQRQRIGIARALIMNPKLVIADEAISALDVSIQAQVVNLMKDLQDEMGITYLFIAHDLSMVKYISDRIGVMHLGYIVETGTTDEIFTNPIHPYTRSLLSAIPHPNPIVEKKRVALTYDKNKEGVDYAAGVIHQLTPTHSVLATEEEFAKWASEKFEV